MVPATNPNPAGGRSSERSIPFFSTAPSVLAPLLFLFVFQRKEQQADVLPGVLQYAIQQQLERSDRLIVSATNLHCDIPGGEHHRQQEV